MTSLDLSFVRSQFPALALMDGGRPAVYFDGPGGTQVPQRVIDAMSSYLVHMNANHGGAFRTSRESDALLAAAHAAMADLLNDSLSISTFSPYVTVGTGDLIVTVDR